MPPRVIRDLQLPAATTDDLNRLRVLFEALGRDPHVVSVSISERTDQPFVREIRVTFQEGFEQPFAPALHHLEQRYPVRPDPEPAFETVMTRSGPVRFSNGPSPDAARRIMDALRANLGEMVRIPSGVFDFVNPCGEIPLGTHERVVDLTAHEPVDPPRPTAWAILLGKIDDLE